MIPVQIIVTKELKNREHLPLKVLSQQADESDIRDFVYYVSQFKEPGDRRNADAVLQISVQANRKIFGEIRRRSQDMCDALKEFFKEDLEEAHARGREEGSRQEAYADLMQIGCSAWCYDKHLAIFITGFHI